MLPHDPRIDALKNERLREACLKGERLVYSALEWVWARRVEVQAATWTVGVAGLLWWSCRDWIFIWLTLGDKWGLILAFVWVAGVKAGVLIARDFAKKSQTGQVGPP